MGLGEFNFLALPVAVVLAVLGAPLAFHRAGFAWAKTIFGTLTVLFATLGTGAVILALQQRTGSSEWLLAWTVLPALGYALYRISGSKAP